MTTSIFCMPRICWLLWPTGFGHVLCSLCAADRFRVLLKGEHPDYIHAVFAHVSSKGAYELVGPGGKGKDQEGGDGRPGGRGRETRREGKGNQEGRDGRPGGRGGGGGGGVASVGVISRWASRKRKGEM